MFDHQLKSIKNNFLGRFELFFFNNFQKLMTIQFAHP